MTSIVVSKHGVPIRLTAERWTHITEEHCELAGLRLEVVQTIGDPERVLEGGGGLSRTPRGRFRDHGVFDAKNEKPPAEEPAMALTDVQQYLQLVPAVKDSPGQYLWSSYDPEADTLYVNFKKPSHATDSELTDEDVIVRYEGDEIVGLTILHASKR